MAEFKILFTPPSWFPYTNGRQSSRSTPHCNSFLYSHPVCQLDHSAHGITITGTHIEETESMVEWCWRSGVPQLPCWALISGHSQRFQKFDYHGGNQFHISPAWKRAGQDQGEWNTQVECSESVLSWSTDHHWWSYSSSGRLHTLWLQNTRPWPLVEPGTMRRVQTLMTKTQHPRLFGRVIQNCP